MENFIGQLLCKGLVVADPVEGSFEEVPASPRTMPTWSGHLYIPPDATIDREQTDYQLRLNDGRTANIILVGPMPGEKATFEGEAAPPEDGPVEP